MDQKIVYSAIQPSGGLTIGNYLGALKGFRDLQENHRCLFSVADMHTITVPQVPKDLRHNTYELYATYLASGIDPEESIVFAQSQVPAHAELCWILNSISYMGQLSRMTQYKDKSQRSEENLNAGLFTYPVLMAADILLYNTDFVPIGDDQKQHLELARDLAERFNHRYSDTFTVPEGMIPKTGSRIFSLQDPTKKMSKSDKDANATILLNDEPDVIRRKIRRAVTDSVGNFDYNDEQLALKNLIEIYSIFSGQPIEKIVETYQGSSYGPFKEDLGEVIVEALAPFQERFKVYMDDKKQLDDYMIQGAEKASYLAQRTLSKVYRKVGFVQPKRR